MAGEAFLSQRIVNREGIRFGAILVREGKISGIVLANEIPPEAKVQDCGESAILPGLVDSHVHINEPGRTEWEGFETATRAAAAGGITTNVDNPLNNNSAPTSVAALEMKRLAARGRCRVDVAFWGGVVPGNERDIEPLIDAGVRGFKCFLVP